LTAIAEMLTVGRTDYFCGAVTIYIDRLWIKNVDFLKEKSSLKCVGQ